MNADRNKLGLLLALCALALAFFVFDGGRHLSLERVQALQGDLQALYLQRPLTMVAAFALLFVGLFALALPVGSVLSLAGGAIFGLWVGVLVVSFASSIGATLAFLGGRYLLADIVRQRFKRPLAAIDNRIAGDGSKGAYTLFTLRLVPVFPPALLSLLFGLTTMPTGRFYAISQLGMLTGTLIYVYAGTQLPSLRTPADVLSPRVLLALAAVGLVPWLLRHVLRRFRPTPAPTQR